MNTHKITTEQDHNHKGSSQNMEKQLREINKEKWLQKYASRILRIWSHWQTPLGVTYDYTIQIKTELANFYENPLKRMFIESTY